MQQLLQKRKNAPGRGCAPFEQLKKPKPKKYVLPDVTNIIGDIKKVQDNVTNSVTKQQGFLPDITDILTDIKKAQDAAKKALLGMKQRKGPRGICVCGDENCNIGPFHIPGGGFVDSNGIPVDRNGSRL